MTKIQCHSTTVSLQWDHGLVSMKQFVVQLGSPCNLKHPFKWDCSPTHHHQTLVVVIFHDENPCIKFSKFTLPSWLSWVVCSPKPSSWRCHPIWFLFSTVSVGSLQFWGSCKVGMFPGLLCSFINFLRLFSSSSLIFPRSALSLILTILSPSSGLQESHKMGTVLLQYL